MADVADAVGLCFTCRWMRAAGNQRGSTFFRCTRADTDSRFVRYPPLPMRTCPGYEEAMLFVVLLHYTKPLDAVDAVRADHLRHLETNAARGVFHAWARRDPAAGGVLLATAPDRATLFFFRHFERIFVLLLVFAMVAIHTFVDQKFAFLSFYYLPMILAGFYGGRRFAVLAGLFVVALVLFYQYVQGLDMLPGFYGDALLALVPWAGFLILTGYVVGTLAEQREARLGDVKNAYLATLELLTYHIESTERNQQGHSNRVADVAVAIGRELDLPEEDVENLRVAALLHEVGTRDQRLLRLLSRSVTDSTVAVARWMRGAAEIIGEYGHY